MCSKPPRALRKKDLKEERYATTRARRQLDPRTRSAQVHVVAKPLSRAWAKVRTRYIPAPRCPPPLSALSARASPIFTRASPLAPARTRRSPSPSRCPLLGRALAASWTTAAGGLWGTSPQPPLVAHALGRALMRVLAL